MADPTLTTDSPSLNQSAPGSVPAPSKPITGPQCRAARALLKWTREDLADCCEIHYITLCNFECGHGELSPAKARLLRLTFVAGGIRFIDADQTGGPGARLTRPQR